MKGLAAYSYLTWYTHENVWFGCKVFYSKKQAWTNQRRTEWLKLGFQGCDIGSLRPELDNEKGYQHLKWTIDFSLRFLHMWV